MAETEVRCPNCDDLIDVAHNAKHCFRCGHPLYKPVTDKSRAQYAFSPPEKADEASRPQPEMFGSVEAVENARNYKGVWATIVAILLIALVRVLVRNALHR